MLVYFAFQKLTTLSSTKTFDKGILKFQTFTRFLINLDTIVFCYYNCLHVYLIRKIMQMFKVQLKQH